MSAGGLSERLVSRVFSEHVKGYNDGYSTDSSVDQASFGQQSNDFENIFDRIT